MIAVPASTAYAICFKLVSLIDPTTAKLGFAILLFWNSAPANPAEPTYNMRFFKDCANFAITVKSSSVIASKTRTFDDLGDKSLVSVFARATSDPNSFFSILTISSVHKGFNGSFAMSVCINGFPFNI